MDANLEAWERGKRKPAPSTRTRDLWYLELRSGGRGGSQARAINTAGGSGYPGGCSCPCQRELARDMWPCLSVSQYLPCHPVTSALWAPLLFMGLPLSHGFCHSPPQGPCFPSSGFCLPSLFGLSFPPTLSVCPPPKSSSAPLGQYAPSLSLAFPLWVSVPHL